MARSPGGGRAGSPGRGGGGGMAAAGGGDGPDRDGSGGGGGTGMASLGAPLELGVEEQWCQGWGPGWGVALPPHSLNTDTCPMPGRGATRCGHRVGRIPQHLCV